MYAGGGNHGGGYHWGGVAGRRPGPYIYILVEFHVQLYSNLAIATSRSICPTIIGRVKQ